MNKTTTIIKAFNPNYVPVHYYNRTTAIYNLYKYSIRPLVYIVLTSTLLLVSAGFLNQ